MYAAMVTVLVGLLAPGAVSSGTSFTMPVGTLQEAQSVVVELDAVRDDDPLAHAIADFAARTGVDPAQVEVVLHQNVIWPDRSLGCPNPDEVYMPALVDGYLIVLRADAEVGTYHGAHGQPPFYCDQPGPDEPGVIELAS